MSRLTPALVEDTVASGFSLQTVRLDTLRPDEALVQIEACGICATDLNHSAAFYPAIKGHEGCGRIEALGEGLKASGKFSIGERIVMCWNYCEECPNCLSGKENYCREVQRLCFDGRRKDGSILAFNNENKEMSAGWFGQSSFSKWTIAHKTSMIKLPDYAKSIPSEIIATICCGIITGAGSVANVLKPDSNSTIAVCGTGNVGLAGLMMAKVMGAKTIIAVDKNADRLKMAESMGASKTVLVTSIEESAIESAIREAGNGELMMVLDTTGFAPVIRGAFLAMEACGVFCSATGYAPIPFNPVEIFTTGKTITGTLEGNSDPHTFIPRLIELYLEGNFPVDKLIKVYGPDQMNEARDDMTFGRTIKGVIKWAGFEEKQA